MNKPCILCGTGERKPVCTKNGFEIVRCVACGLVFVDPMPSPVQIEEYYREGYDQFRYSFASPSDAPPKRRMGELRLLERHAGTRRSVLDVGAAFGHFLSNARTHGWEVTGVEPQNNARARARERFQLEIRESVGEVPDQCVDAATLWHVIEHIATPVDFLVSIRPKLRQGGIVAVTTPNINSLVARATGESWGWLSPPDHLFLYSPHTLPRLLERTGFEVLEVGTRRGQSRNTMFLMLQAVAYRLGLFGQLKQSVARAAETVRSRPSGRNALNIFWLAEKVTEGVSFLLTPVLVLLWKAGLGDEVYAVGRKKGEE
jgi:SAM-dependent methyltransferase